MNEEKLFEDIWSWIRELKNTYKHDDIVKVKATYWGFAGKFQEQDPSEIAKYLKNLVDSKRVTTNFFEEGVFPLDAYILPSNF